MDLRISDLLAMQTELQQLHPEWGGTPPSRGRDQLMWGIGEIGEVIDIIKKNGAETACSDETLRRDLIEELADVLMYYNDVLLCYGITEEELKKSYTEKFKRNINRW